MHVYKPPRVGGLDRVPVFTAGTGSTRADLFELDGVTPMPDNVLVADTSGNLPSFQCATSPVYVGASGSRTTWTPSESGEPSAASLTVVRKTTAYTAVNGNVVLGDASGGAFSVTLPAPTSGATVTVKNVGATGLVGVAPHAAELTEGAASVSVAHLASTTLVADGTDWWII